MTTFAYLPTSLLYVIPMMRYRPDVITPEARAIPQKVWIIMGCLDSLAGVMQSLAVDKILSGSLTVLLLQSAIPTSMLITKLFLRTSYRASQYIGALVVIAGLAAALGPTLAQGTGGEGATDTAIWSSVLILSCVPMCLSSVYKEKALGDTEIDAIYLNFWVAVWQFVLGFPLLLPMAPASNLPISQIGSNLLNGAKCYAGINSMDGDNCGLAPLFVTVYILFNLAYNILIILSEWRGWGRMAGGACLRLRLARQGAGRAGAAARLLDHHAPGARRADIAPHRRRSPRRARAVLKYGSSNILWLCLTLQVPVANLVFAVPWMPKSQPASLWNVLGLALIMAGLVTYRFWPLVHERLVKLGWAKDAPKTLDNEALLQDGGEE